MKILIVEDEEKLRNSLAEGLRLKGYAIDVAGDGESADEKAFYERYDLIILDLNLPKIDGFSVLENFRKENLDVPVLILSARDGIEDIVCTPSHHPVRDSSGSYCPASVCWEHLRNRPSGMVYYCHSQRKITANRPCKSVEGMSDIKEDTQ